MTPSEEHENTSWDPVFDFLADEVDEMSQEEVRAELRSFRINVEPTVHQIKHALQVTEAREAMEKAPLRRARILEKLRDAVLQPIENARRDIRAFLQSQRLSTVHQVYFNRLESAASEEDLRSLVEDLAALDLFDDEDTNGKQQET
ncbi:MAG: hypothetical protein PVJ57_03620 [Phycisphaerae bacterium]|jgi:hypothetical protein